MTKSPAKKLGGQAMTQISSKFAIGNLSFLDFLGHWCLGIGILGNQE